MTLWPGSVIRLDDTEHVGAVIVPDGPGRYHADIAVNLSGKWSYRWSAGAAGDAGEFFVEASAFVERQSREEGTWVNRQSCMAKSGAGNC
jgi:hypothetical protein